MELGLIEVSAMTIDEIEDCMHDLENEIASTENTLSYLDEDDDDYDEQVEELQIYLEELESQYAELDFALDLKDEDSE